jgi:hypothetical protein
MSQRAEGPIVGRLVGAGEGSRVTGGLGVAEDCGAGDAGAAEATAVRVAVGVGVGVGSGTVAVAEGPIPATNVCSCTPNTMATSKVNATKAAASSPLRSGPSPLASRPWPGLLCRSRCRDFILSYVDLVVRVCHPARRRSLNGYLAGEWFPLAFTGKITLKVAPTPLSLSTHRRPP